MKRKDKKCDLKCKKKIENQIRKFFLQKVLHRVLSVAPSGGAGVGGASRVPAAGGRGAPAALHNIDTRRHDHPYNGGFFSGKSDQNVLTKKCGDVAEHV